MAVLFNESPEQRPPSQHGILLGTFILAHINGDDSYHKLRRAGMGHGLGLSHYRAKSCPHRPSSERGRGFTEKQSEFWIASMQMACLKDFKVGEEFTAKFILWLASMLGHYAPFIKD